MKLAQHKKEQPKKKPLKLRQTKAPAPVAYFTGMTKRSDYVDSKCEWCDPMLAKEITDAEQEKFFKDDNILVEEKFDGTRGILQFFDNRELHLKCLPLNKRGFTRCFSRRVSKKTDWFCENTDSVPHLRDINVPELAGTIIDGEMFIDGQPFKAVSSTLNCLWDEAVRRQKDLGKITFHAFDILAYKGKNVENKPLSERKELLQKVVDAVNSPYLVFVPFYTTQEIEIKIPMKHYKELILHSQSYPELWKTVQKQGAISLKTVEHEKPTTFARYKVSKKGYYEFIVLCGGEGVILKPLNGKYYHKRGKEYMKVKKFLTREVVVTGFIPPSREYTGGFPKDTWSYWIDKDGEKIEPQLAQQWSAKQLCEEGNTPVTRFYFYDQIGTIEYGVVLEKDDPSNIQKFKELDVKYVTVEGISKRVVVVGECSGFTDEERENMTEHKNELIGKVIEVKANELFKDTGKMRHPRFLRFREDKSALECTWKNHVGVDTVD